MNNFLVQNEIIVKKALIPFLHVKKEVYYGWQKQG